MNEQKEALEKKIIIHWWNLGTKTLDHRGTYKEFFDMRDIKISKIKHPASEYDGLRFKMSLGASIITFEDFSGSFTSYDYAEKFDSVIKLFLTHLGDRHLFVGNRTYRINWS